MQITESGNVKTEETTFKIGEVAKRLGTSIRTIRYYEEEKLIMPIRTAGGTRLYTEKHLWRLKAILNLIQTGFSIDTIRLIGSIRNECQNGDENSKKASLLLTEAFESAIKRIEELEVLKDVILSAQKQVQGCLGCVNKPSSQDCPTCPIRKHRQDIEILNLIWDQN